MSCQDQCQQPAGQPISQVLQALGPRTVEGDQGRWTGYTVDEAIRADQYERSKCALRTRQGMTNALRYISGNRLAAHDGPGS